MKKLNYIIAAIIVSVMLWGGSTLAQDQGTYIDNATPQDSSYVEGDELSFEEFYEEESNSCSIVVIIGAAIVIAGVVVVVVRRRKNKK